MQGHIYGQVKQYTQENLEMEKGMGKVCGDQAKQILIRIKDNINKIIKMAMEYTSGQMEQPTKVILKTI